ncbi:MAG: hypothetical protein ACKV0T_25265 [Planctomycetales bacterium]
MTDYPNDGMCHETSGFLFSHRCDRFAVQACDRCSKPLCQDHAHPLEEGMVCTTCVRTAGPSETRNDRDDDIPDGDSGEQEVTGTSGSKPAPARSRSTTYYDDPYFYGPTWYPGYGGYRRRSSTTAADQSGAGGGDFDPDDFTEGDAESLRMEGDGSFEADMGES